MRAKWKWIIAALAVAALVAVVTVVAASAGLRGVDLTVTGFETNRVPGVSYGRVYTNYLVVSAKLELKNASDHAITFPTYSGTPDYSTARQSPTGWQTWLMLGDCSNCALGARSLSPGQGVTFKAAIVYDAPCRVSVPYYTDDIRFRVWQHSPTWLVKRFPSLGPRRVVFTPVIDLGGKEGS